jgi:hypothetical protein
MSLSYTMLSKRGEYTKHSFDANSAGCFCLAAIHQATGLPCTDGRVPYESGPNSCESWADELMKPENKPIIIAARPSELFEGSDEEYYAYAFRWATFLRRCAKSGGYEVM